MPLTIIIHFPYTCISSFFGSSIPTALFIFKMFFRSLIIIVLGRSWLLYCVEYSIYPNDTFSSQWRIRQPSGKLLSKPENDFYSGDDFFKLVVNCHILVAAMKVLEMGSLTDTPHEAVLPNAENICMVSNHERKSLLFEVCKNVCNYISVKYDPASGTIDNVRTWVWQAIIKNWLFLNRVFRCN